MEKTVAVVNDGCLQTVRDEEYEYHMAVFELSSFVLKYGWSKVAQDLDNACLALMGSYNGVGYD